MKRGIRLEYDSDRGCVYVTKKKGKLTLDDITEAIMDAQDYGHFAIILNCSMAAADGVGFWDEDEPEGDVCTLYPIDEYEKCPVCDQVTPLLEYCPECGARLKQRDDREVKS